MLRLDGPRTLGLACAGGCDSCQVTLRSVLWILTIRMALGGTRLDTLTASCKICGGLKGMDLLATPRRSLFMTRVVLRGIACRFSHLSWPLVSVRCWRVWFP